MPENYACLMAPSAAALDAPQAGLAMAPPRISALTLPSLAEAQNDAHRIKSLDARERTLALLSMAIWQQNPSIVKEQVAAALEAGATDDELESIYDCALLTEIADEPKDSLSVLSDHIDASRGHDLPSTRILRLSDHATIVRDTGGPGIPIILLHALSMDGSMYRAMYPSLSKSARVIMYDIRGFGYAQDAPVVKNFAQLADDLGTLLDVLSIETADIFGTSYGGAVAQQFAVQYPKRVRSIAVLASVKQGFPTMLDRATNAEKFGMESMVPPTLMRWLLPENVASNTWAVRYARTCVKRARGEQWAAAWRAMVAFDVAERFSDIEVPVLAVGGKQDVSTPAKMVSQIAEASKRGKYVEIDPGTHMMVIEQPERLVEILQEFRRSVDEGHA